MTVIEQCAESKVKKIRKLTRNQYLMEEKIRIVVEGIKG